MSDELGSISMRSVQSLEGSLKDAILVFNDVPNCV